jgi:hypothetical protein
MQIKSGSIGKIVRAFAYSLTDRMPLRVYGIEITALKFDERIFKIVLDALPRQTAEPKSGKLSKFRYFRGKIQEKCLRNKT